MNEQARKAAVRLLTHTGSQNTCGMYPENFCEKCIEEVARRIKSNAHAEHASAIKEKAEALVAKAKSVDDDANYDRYMEIYSEITALKAELEKYK